VFHYEYEMPIFLQLIFLPMKYIISLKWE